MNKELIISFNWKSLHSYLEVEDLRISCLSSHEGFKTAIGEFVLRPYNKVKTNRKVCVGNKSA